jgi:hypothetical protein
MTHHSKLFLTLFIYLATSLASAEAVDADHKMPISSISHQKTGFMVR